MAKPRRKHPGLNVAEGSPQGEVFVSILMSFLGEEMWWKALEQTEAKSIVFLVGGSRGNGVLVEKHERAEDDAWVHQWGFRYEPEGLGVIAQMEFCAHRWDPGLYAEISGDRSLLEQPASDRRRVQEQKSWEVGRERDRLQMTVLPRETPSMMVCGIPMSEIEEIVERHAEKTGEGGREVGMIRSSSEDAIEKERLLSGNFPLVD